MKEKEGRIEERESKSLCAKERDRESLLRKKVLFYLLKFFVP